MFFAGKGRKLFATMKQNPGFLREQKASEKSPFGIRSFFVCSVLMLVTSVNACRIF